MRGRGQPDRRDQDEGEQHRRGKPVDTTHRGTAGDAVRQDDVRGEQSCVGERERDSGGLADEVHARQQVDTRGSRGDRGEVAPDARADHREGNRPDELDRGDRCQRKAVDCDVEAGVHDCEDRAKGDDQRPAAAIECDKLAPRPSPDREDQSRRRDPQPGDAEHLDAGEQEHGERGAQVVEDGAADEVGVGRYGGDAGSKGDALILRTTG